MNFRTCCNCDQPTGYIIKSLNVKTLRLPVCETCGIETLALGGWERLFSPKVSRQRTEAAITEVSDHGDPAWKTAALLAIYEIATTSERFTTDEVWKLVGPPREPRLLGAVVREAARMGWIAKTGTTQNSSMVTCHSREKAVWESLLAA